MVGLLALLSLGAFSLTLFDFSSSSADDEVEPEHDNEGEKETTAPSIDILDFALDPVLDEETEEKADCTVQSVNELGTSSDDHIIDGTISNSGTELLAGGGGDGYTLVDSSGENEIDVGSGNDTVLSAGADIYGGAGDDVLSNYSEVLLTGDDASIEEIELNEIRPENTLHGEEGNDQIDVVGGNAFGGEGDDTITGYGYFAGDIQNNGGYSATPSLSLDGGDGDDSISGRNNLIFGGEGDDYLSGFDSNIEGGPGNDTIIASGTTGFDGQSLHFDGGAGDDLILSDQSEAYVPMREVSASYEGGPGDDYIDARSLADWIEVSGGEGADTIHVEARNSIYSESQGSQIRSTVSDYDVGEDELVIDLPVSTTTIDGNSEIDIEIEFEEVVVDGETSTQVRVSLADDSQAALYSHDLLDSEARYVILKGVAVEDVDPTKISVRTANYN